MNDYFNAQSAGLRLAEERERLGLSKVALAEVCDVRREMIGRYEKGEAAPGAEVLAKLLALGADVAYILTGMRMAAAVSDQRPKAVNLDPRTNALLDNYMECSEEDQRAIEQMALRFSETKHKTTDKPIRGSHPKRLAKAS